MEVDKEAADKITRHVSLAFMTSIKEWVDRYVETTDYDRRMVTAVVAKCLIMDGSMLMAAALDIGADPGMEIVAEALHKFRTLGKERQERL